MIFILIYFIIGTFVTGINYMVQAFKYPHLYALQHNIPVGKIIIQVILWPLVIFSWVVND